MIRPTVLAFSYNCFSLFYKTSPPYNTFSSSTSKAFLYQIGNKSLRVHIPLHSRFLCKSAQSTNMDSKDLYLYNTMTKQKEVFKPKDPGKVSMYVCGITAYDFSHIGHARVYVTFDILYRYLQYLGYEVKYVRNFTDIDDKTLKDCEDFLLANVSEKLHQPIPKNVQECVHRVRSSFISAMSNDLHVPMALAALSEPLKVMNDLMHTRQGRKEKARIESLEILEVVRSILDALGLLSSKCSEVIMELKRKALIRAGLSEEELMQMIRGKGICKICKKLCRVG